jgi:CubicO group peptidase (beta-lactamase class C family)
LTQAQFIQAIGVHALEFQPGESWKYSNSGYNLLGYIVENVGSRSYWQFLRERILLPLEMNATTDRNPATIITNRADGYENTSVAPVNRDYDVTDVFAAGAIVSTVGDLAKWGAAIESDKLLTARTKEQMWTPQKLNDGNATRYGFGWRIETLEGRRNVGHSGSTSGFSASFQRFPDDCLTIVLLTNTGEQIATSLARKAASLHLADDNLK